MKQFYLWTANLRIWNNFRIYAVNGSTKIPESKENYEVFGGNPSKTEIVSPLASASVLYDVLNNILVKFLFIPIVTMNENRFFPRL